MKKQIDNIIFTGEKVRRILDGKVLELIIPDPELGYYKSLMLIKSYGIDIEKLAEKQTIELNPTRFEKLDPVLETINPDEWDDGSDPKSQVDFELLVKTWYDCAKGERIANDKEAQNLNIFFELMEDESFAIQASKEFKRLNN